MLLPASLNRGHVAITCSNRYLLVGRMQERLVESIFGREQGLMGTVGGDPRDAAVLMSGLPGSVAAAVSRRMTAEGIERERVLICDYV